MSRLLAELGHDVIVVNPRKLRLIDLPAHLLDRVAGTQLGSAFRTRRKIHSPEDLFR